jgi:hypothetical protein
MSKRFLLLVLVLTSLLFLVVNGYLVPESITFAFGSDISPLFY